MGADRLLVGSVLAVLRRAWIGRNVKQENAGAGGSVRRKTYVQPTLNLAAGAKTATLARLQVAPSLNGFSHSKIGCPVGEKSRLH